MFICQSFFCSENRMFCIPSLANNTRADKSSSSGKGSVTPHPQEEVQSLTAISPRDGEINCMTAWSTVLCKIFKDRERALCPFMGSGVEEVHKSVSHNKWRHSRKECSEQNTGQMSIAQHSECFLIQSYHCLLQCQSLVWLQLLVVEHPLIHFALWETQFSLFYKFAP